MTYEFIVICLYLFFGVCFGFVTFQTVTSLAKGLKNLKTQIKRRLLKVGFFGC